MAVFPHSEQQNCKYRKNENAVVNIFQNKHGQKYTLQNESSCHFRFVFPKKVLFLQSVL